MVVDTELIVDTDSEDSPRPESPEPQIRLTNFSIAEILKPEFGVKKCRPFVISSPNTFDDRSSGSASPVSLDGSPRGEQDSNDGVVRPNLWPAWVYCTRYSDRPSSGPRSRKKRKAEQTAAEKRPRTAFTEDQLQRLKKEFDENRYLTEQRRQNLSDELNLNESQIKIWFQNKRAKLKKTSGVRNSLALHLMAQGLYNHASFSVKEEDTS